MGRTFQNVLMCGAVLWLCAASRVLGEDQRDPFWPVGYSPVAAQPVPQEEDNLLDLSKLSPEEQAIIKAHMRVGGILEQGDRRFAIINSDVVSEGEELDLRVSGQVYRFLIKSLKPQQIVLEPMQQNVEPESK